MSEPVHCVAFVFKITERTEQQICIKFCTKLEHSSAETIWMIQKAATGDWQLHHDNVSAHASHLVQIFLVKHRITQVTQPPYSPDFVSCDFWVFPKLKSPLKENRYETIDEIQENTVV